jgi:hypothetical protein
VATKLGTSNVTVSSIRKQFIVEAEEVGVLGAAANYGVEEQVGKLMDIGAVVEATGVDASRAPLGLRIVKAVKDFGVEEDVAPAFIEACYAEPTRQGMKPEGFVKAVLGLRDLKVQDGKSYSDLLNYVAAKDVEAKELDSRVYEYGLKADAAKTRMSEAVADEKTTLAELKQFASLRDTLAPHGLDLRSVEKAKNCILNVEKRGGDSEAVVAFYSESVDLEERKSKAESRLSYVSTESLRVENSLRDANKEFESKKDLVDRVREAEDLKIRPKQLGVIVEKTREVGARHGWDGGESISRLEVDLEENWEPKLGFENEKVALEEKLGLLKENVKLAEGRERVALENARAQEQALSGLAELRKHISPSEIVEFKRIIVDSGQDVPTFRSEVQRLGAVTAAVDAEKNRRDAIIAKLRGDETALSSQVAQLEKRKRSLEADIETLSGQTMEVVDDAVTRIKIAAEEVKFAFENPDTGYEATIKRLGEEAKQDMSIELKAQRAALKSELDNAAGSIKKFVAEAEVLRKETWDTAKLIGSNTHLTRLVILIGGEQIPRDEALITMKMTVDSFQSYFIRNKITWCPSAARLSQELLGGLL